VPEVKRLRLSSIDSIEADDDLMTYRLRAAADAASAPVAAVRRRPDPEAHEAPPSARRFDPLLRGCARLRPDIVFGADIIAGFPTETEAMFENSLKLVDECGLTICMSFRSAPRRHAGRAHAAGRKPKDWPNRNAAQPKKLQR
jgi:threonylcarbamoyladenosine tRNA methylthiotransferase MtaB